MKKSYPRQGLRSVLRSALSKLNVYRGETTMNKDIRDILEGWEYKPDRLSVRKILGIDGKEKIQVRIDLGLLQMETEGRPDGRRPYGKESLLQYYLDLIEGHKAKYGKDEDFRLNQEDCEKLSREGIQYYHRYLSLFELEDYEGVARDTERNLRVFDLVRQYAEDEQDIGSFEQYRPYVIMMNTRAKSLISMEKKDYKEALKYIRRGIEGIEDVFRGHQREDLIETSPELSFLKTWQEEVLRSRPLPLKEKLQDQLKEAIDREDFEEAAELRDRIRQMED